VVGRAPSADEPARRRSPIRARDPPVAAALLLMTPGVSSRIRERKTGLCAAAATARWKRRTSSSPASPPAPFAPELVQRVTERGDSTD
jgi:hypothetical protein